MSHLLAFLYLLHYYLTILVFDFFVESDLKIVAGDDFHNFQFIPHVDHPYRGTNISWDFVDFYITIFHLCSCLAVLKFEEGGRVKRQANSTI